MAGERASERESERGREREREYMGEPETKVSLPCLVYTERLDVSTHTSV